MKAADIRAEQDAAYDQAKQLDQMRAQNKQVERVVAFQDDWERAQNLEKLNSLTPEERRELMVERILVDEDSQDDEPSFSVQGDSGVTVEVPLRTLRLAATRFQKGNPLMVRIPLLCGPKVGNAKRDTPYYIYKPSDLERLECFLEAQGLVTREEDAFEILTAYAVERAKQLGIPSDELLSQLIDNGMKHLEIVDLLSNGVAKEEILPILMEN